MLSQSDYIHYLTQELAAAKPFSRTDVYSTFEPFVDSKETLHSFVDSGNLHYDYVKYRDAFRGTVFEDGIRLIVHMVRQANAIDAAATRTVLVESYRRITQGFASYTQTMWLQSPKIEHSREDVFVKAAFQKIGDFVENSLKPYLILLNNLRGIIQQRDTNQSKLGTVIDALISYNESLCTLYKDIFLGIKLSQWRNISDHGDYKYSTEGICISYGPENNRQSQMISCDELLQVLKMLDNLLYMHKTAVTLVALDNVDMVKQAFEHQEKTDFSKQDDCMSQIVETSFAYGYLVRELDLSKKPCELEIERHSAPKDKEELENYFSFIASFLRKDYTVTVYWQESVEYRVIYSNKTLRIYHYNY